MQIKIPVINKSNNELPQYATTGAAGADVRCFCDEPIVLQAGARALIPTGLYAAVPHGYEIQVRPRSGLAVKHGVTCLNSPGTIDSDYRGEIKVLLINHGVEKFVVQNGERIAQLVLAKVEQASFEVVENLDDTQRGVGGFGHTGKD